MTKKETQVLQEMAVKACEKFHRLCCEYVKENYPRGYGYWLASKDGYLFNDQAIYGAMVEDMALRNVLKQFGIEYKISNLAAQYIREEIEWLSNGVEEVWGKVWA